jgi:hypothetical protein
MRLVSQIAALGLAALGGLASAGGGGGLSRGVERHWSPERDPELEHVLLCVQNLSADLVRVFLRGPVERLVVIPPRESSRVLLPAGSYRVAMARGDRKTGVSVAVLRARHRYTVEVSP